MAAAARSGIGYSGALVVRKASRRQDSSTSYVNSPWMVRFLQPRHPVMSIAISIDRRALQLGSIPVMSASSDSSPAAECSKDSSLSFLEAESEAVATTAAALELDEDTAAADILLPPTVPAKTVHVRFRLQEECSFGQQFLLVGDDPLLGLWDPTKGILLDWSEGHVWTTELDLPVEKSIEFKFILQDQKGELCWQGGPNRILQTRDTANTLVVYEDWDDEQKQITSEEDALAVAMEDSSTLADKIGSNGGIMRVYGHQVVDSPEPHGESSVEKISNEMDDEEKLNSTNGQPVVTLTADEVKAREAKVSSSSQLLSEKEMETEPEIFSGLLEVGTVSESLDDKNNGDNSQHAADASASSEENLYVKPESQAVAGTIQNCILWVRKAVQKFLLSLGFETNPTESSR